MIMQRVLAPYLHELSLKEWAEKYLMIEKYWENITSDSYRDYSEELARYCSGDAFSTWKLYEYMREEFQEEIISAKNALEIDFMMIIPTAYMIHHGIKLDEKALQQVKEEIYNELITLENKLVSEYNINIRSNKQLLEKFREEGYQLSSVSRDVLNTLDNRLAKEVLKYRDLYTLYSRYLAKITDYCDSYGVIHSDIKISGAVTGRPTSTNPNLLNINPRVRKIFCSVFDDGILVSADKNQAEFRVLGYLSKSKKILEGYRNGVDFHTLTANLVKVDRKIAKRLNFAFIYGATENRLKSVLIDAGYDEKSTERLVKEYVSVMKTLEIESYQKSLIKQAEEKGYVESPFGRRGYKLNYTQIVNYPIQSFASDINKMGIIQLFYEMKRENLVSRIWLDFYDAIEIDVYQPELEKVKELVQNITTKIPDIYGIGEYHIPVEISLKGKNWA
jgi:DNA polymerase-1